MSSISQNLNLAKQEKSNLLRNILAFDGVGSMLFGIAGVVGANWIANFFGLSESLPFIIVGVALFIFGASMAYFSRSENIPAWFAWLAIELDTLWVLASLVLVFTGAFGISDAGKWALFLVADMVIVIAGLKYLGLRQLQK